MAHLLGLTSFGARSTARDRLTVVAGALVYDAANTPSDSPSTTSAGGAATVRAPWHNDVAPGTPFTPATAELWLHARLYPGTNDAANDSVRIGVGRTATEYVSISLEDNTLRPTIRVAGVVRATAEVALRAEEWARLHVHVEGALAGDEVHLYLAGDLSAPVLSYTLVAADATNLAAIGGLPNEHQLVGRAGDRFDDLVALDPTAVGFPGIQYFAVCGIAEVLVTGDGPESDWDGSFADIDERPGSDLDAIAATGVNLESSFVKPMIAEPNVLGVKVLARVTQTGGGAGLNLGLKLNNGVAASQVTVPVPVDGDVQAIFSAAPDGSTWTPPKYDETRVAFRSLT